MQIILSTIGGILFLVSAAAYIYVRIKLKPAQDSDVDDYYYEFEHQHPEYARYLKWSKITFSSVIAAILLLFLALML